MPPGSSAASPRSPDTSVDPERLLGTAIRLGADECEVARAARRVTTIRITDSAVSEAKQVSDDQYGIRLVARGRIASASVPAGSGRISETVGRMMHASGSIQRPCRFWRGLAEPVSRGRPGELRGTYDARLDRMTCREAEDLAERMIVAASNKKVGAITGSLHVVCETFEVSNTRGLHDVETSTYVAGLVNAESALRVRGASASGAAAQQQQQSQQQQPPLPYPTVSGIGYGSARTLDGFDPERAGADACEMCISSENPASVDGGTYTVIFEPYSVGELLAFVVAPNFELKRVLDGRSCFSGSTGRPVASELLTIRDDPHAPDAIGSHRIDAEGVPTAGRPLVKRGVFEGTYSDLFDYYRAVYDNDGDDSGGDDDNGSDANHGGASGDAASDNHDAGNGPPAGASDSDCAARGTLGKGRVLAAAGPGNAARMAVPMGRGADPIPVSAPHNMSVSSDVEQIPPDEMVQDVKKGLLVGRLWYTYAVNPISGDFSCTARSGVFLIRDGQIVSPTRPVRIMHSLPALLRDVSGIGNDARSVVQWASLSSVAPSLRVENVPVIRI
ncbi:MAG: TldD/PmbA family protein [Nitrosopumilaceae archaeon]|nr:TldD/PmbA family protein [Nitrosopumilaceae archaeon]